MIQPNPGPLYNHPIKNSDNFHHLLSLSWLPTGQSWGAGGVATVATVGTNLKWD